MSGLKVSSLESVPFPEAIVPTAITHLSREKMADLKTDFKEKLAPEAMARMR